jgi:hypothetical protein
VLITIKQTIISTTKLNIHQTTSDWAMSEFKALCYNSFSKQIDSVHVPKTDITPIVKKFNNTLKV